MRHSIFTAALLFVTALSSANATPVATSTASISNIRFSIQDLNLMDGISPWYSLSPRSTSISANASSPSDSLWFTRNINPGVVGSLNTIQQTLDGVSQVGINLTGAATTLTGSTTLRTGSYSASMSGSGGSAGGQIALSANSILTITGTISASATASNTGCFNYYYYCGNSASARANVSLSYGYYVGTSYITGSSQDSVYAYVSNYYWNQSPRSTSDTHNFTLFFVNMSNATQYANLSLSSSISGGVTSAVPEADAYAMGLAGFAVAGLLARRRRLMAS